MKKSNLPAQSWDMRKNRTKFIRRDRFMHLRHLIHILEAAEFMEWNYTPLPHKVIAEIQNSHSFVNLFLGKDKK